ncbi:MAG: FmdB family zinc ribbon protein [Terracidiphilus sp.]
MPLYEYRCTQCGHRFEKIQHFNTEPETQCPKCHGALIRPLTAPALQFKGAGWYVNDYASKGTSSASDDKPADSGAKPATETKTTESAKPAASESAAKPASTEAAAKPAASSSSSSE